MQETIIVDIQIPNKEVVNVIEQTTQRINELKAEEKNLRDERKKGEVDEESYLKTLTAIRNEQERMTQARQAASKQLKDNIKEEKTYADSLMGLRTELKKATLEWDNMTKAEREGAKGKELLKHIQDVTQELSAAEQASGRFQRNVGNYPSAFKGFEKYLPMLQGGIKGVTTNLAAMGKQLLKLLANPIVAIVAAAVVVFNKLREALKRNDEALTSLQRLFASFKPILDIFRAALDAIVTVLGKVFTAVSKVVTGIMSLIPGIKEFADAEQDLVNATDALEDKEREYTINSAKRSAQISEIRAKAADKDKYTAKERVAMLNQAAKLEKQDLKESKAIAKEKLRLAKEQARVNKDTSDETKNNIAQLEAAVWQAEQSYNDGMRSIVKQTNKAIAEIGAEEDAAIKARKEAAKKAAETAKARRKNELAERRALEDAVLTMVADGIEKEKELLRVANRRHIEDLKTRLKEEKDLTKAARAAINEQIILAEAKLQLDLEKIDKENRQRIARAQIEYERVLSNAEATATKQYYDAQTLAYKNALNERLLAAKDNAEETAWIQEQEARRALDIATMKQKGILRINYETEEAYQLALEQANSAVIEAQKNVADAAKKTAEAIQTTKDTTAKAVTDIAGSFNTIAGNFEDLFSTLAENDDRYSDYATAMAYLQILVSTAVSIANAIQGATAAAASTGVAAPFTLPSFIAEMVGIVTGAIAQTTSLMMKASNKPQTPKFSSVSRTRPTYAEGGVIHGAGTGTSDSITARVSNGESVMTAKATSMFYDQLSAMNVAGGGRPFDRRGGNRFAKGGVVSTQTLMSGRQMQELGRALAEAVENIHPVVSVREITSVQNKIETKERISRR